MADALVTGATGLVGFNIATALAERGREVRALVRSRAKASQLLPAAVELFEGDVCDRDGVEQAMSGCQTVYHAAGLPEQWLADTRRFHEVNVVGTQNMIDAARAAAVRKFVFISTIDVFSAEPGDRFDERNLDPHPKKTAYSYSKQQADQRVVAAEKEGLPAVFIHPAAVYGPGPAGSPGLNEFIGKFAAGKVPMVPPGTLPVVYAPDLAELCIDAERNADSGERFIACESCHTFRDLSCVVAAHLKLTKIPREMPLWMARLIATTSEFFSRFTGKPPLIHAGQLHTLSWVRYRAAIRRDSS